MEINIYSREQEFHRFSTDDFALIEIGLGSYTVSSLNSLLTSGPNNSPPEDLLQFFGGANNLSDILLGVNVQQSMSINEFDIVNKNHRPLSGFSNIISLDPTKYARNRFTPPVGDILAFLIGWNNVQRGGITSPQAINGYKAVVYNIHNSSSGCITFPATYAVLGENRTSTIKLHLLESIDSESSRSMSFKGSPIITSIPERPYGSKYGFRNTTNSPAGAYFSPGENGNDNPTNTVSASLDMAFDPSVGRWQSGTQQMLMRLVDDIEPASVPDLEPNELLLATRSEYYEGGQESPFRITPTKGRAIPMSAENGNIHLFGPDYKDGCTGNDQAIVYVINRMNISYKAGTVVVCSKMLGDGGVWTIIGGIGKEESQAERKTLFGNFEFQQHIVPANIYFTDPVTGTRIMPDVWATKIRIDYYLRLLQFAGETSVNGGFPVQNVGGNGYNIAGLDSQTFRNTVLLNLAALAVPPEASDPIESIKQLYDPELDTASLAQDARVGGMSALDFIAATYCTRTQVLLPPNEHETRFALPKNIIKRSACSANSDLVIPIFGGCDDVVGAQAVPVFWGMLFPDGYKSETTRRFIDTVRNLAIFKDDLTLSELTAASTECVYDFNDRVKNLRFAQYLGIPAGDGLPYIRRTGGLYRNLQNIRPIINNPAQIVNYINMTSPNVFDVARMNTSSNIYGAEPINPGKIQFSSLSIEALYSASSINAQQGTIEEGRGFYHLYTTMTNPGYIANMEFSANGATSTMREYANFMLWQRFAGAGTFRGRSEIDSRNTYNMLGLSVADVYPPQIIGRHQVPFGTLMGNRLSIAPEVENDNGRITAMPILTCKSTLTTNAGSLLFTVDQSFGAVKKRVVTPGQAPQVTLLPIGGGIGWSTPGQSPKVYGTPQWGSRSDGIDVFGTTALHVRVFEHVPPNQLIYIGPIFTPLHFSSSEPLFKYETETLDDGRTTIRLTNEPNRLPIDFQVPTYKLSRQVIPVDSAVTSEILASPEDWRPIAIRRGKLLTKGGFYYFRNVIVVSNVMLEENGGGRGYVSGDKLVLPDNSEIVITSTTTEDGTAGIINGFSFRANFVGQLTKTPTNGLRSLEVVPRGGSGSGAKFRFSFTVKYNIGHDPEPKESTNSAGTRVTSKNNSGEEFIQIQQTRTVDLTRTGNNKKFDVFYFYHNDPSHYSMDEGLVYSNGRAQYVISEVKGQ